MKGKLVALFLALLIAFVLPMAFAADSRIESVEYEGFGIVKIEFTRDCDWYNSAKIALTDADGADSAYVFIGGEDEECYLRAADIVEGADYTLNFVLGETQQSVAFKANSGVEYKVNANGNVAERKENDRCDLCKSTGHDDDFCTERIDEKTLPTNPDELARLFDIDRCERCGGMGHDDDRCPGK